MDVRCEKCMTVYEFDDSKVGEHGVTVKCTQCGNLFKVKRRETTAEMPFGLNMRPPAPASATVRERPAAAPATRTPAPQPAHTPAARERVPTPAPPPAMERTPTPARAVVGRITPTPTPVPRTISSDDASGWMIRMSRSG